MISPLESLAIGTITGAILGYALGFLIARAIYRSPNWPETRTDSH